MTNLPAEVIQRDQRLQRSADELMELRWHWTLDESNTDRVGFSEYGREVGRDESAIRRDANAWAAYLETYSDGSVRTPGTAHTPSDFRELARLTTERQEAAKAIARTSGKSVGTVARSNREEINDVLNTARERAIDRGTTVEHEIDRAAEFRAKARKAAEREQDERRKRTTMRFVEIEGHVGAAMQRLRKILETAEAVDFTSEERELLTESLGKLRALLNLIDLRIAGETNIDWDAALERLVN